jgi:hypothetical protein
MNDMTPTIIAKSDQLNSDDLTGGAITVKIRDARVSESGEQRVSIFYDGDNGKPFKPCKSMCRVLVTAWGDDSRKYIGKLMTLFRDPDVTWAGMKVGGIRISHMSDIGSGDKTLPLTVTRGSKKAYTVKPLVTAVPLTDDEIRDLKRGGELAAKKGTAELKSWWKRLGGIKQQQLGAAWLTEMQALAAQNEPAPSANNDSTDIPNSDNA